MVAFRLFVCSESSIVSHSCVQCAHIYSLVPHSSPPQYNLAFFFTLGLIFHHLYHNNIFSFLLDFFFLISSLASLQIKAIKSPLITPTSPPLIYLSLSPLISIWRLASCEPHSVPWSCVTLPWSLSAWLAFLIFILYCWFTYQIAAPPRTHILTLSSFW